MFTVKVAFTKEKEPDFVSKMIMKFMGTNYSHVFFILDGYIYQSTGEGTHRCNLENYLETHVIVDEYMVALALMTPESFRSYMAGAKGKGYGHWQYLGFMFPWLQKFVTNGSSRQICSELVAEVLRDYRPMKLPKNADFMSPKDVNILLRG